MDKIVIQKRYSGVKKCEWIVQPSSPAVPLTFPTVRLLHLAPLPNLFNLNLACLH